jgi:epoxyqueuosine reductase QueG
MPKTNADHLTGKVKEIARQQGAVLVGVAPIERWEPMAPLYDKAPRGHHPKDFLPEARSVISIAQPVLNPVMDATANLAVRDLEMIPPAARFPYMEAFYHRMGHVVQDCMLEFIAQMIGQYLLSQGYDAMIFPTTGLHPEIEGLTDKQTWEGPNEKWASRFSPFRYTFGTFSHRHTATRAGLGEFGYNNIVLTPQFGPRQRFNSIVTDADLVADPLLAEQVCLRDKCLLCLKACIMSCITLRDDKNTVDYRSLERIDKTAVFIDTPAKTDPTLCRRRRDGNPNSPVRGDCARVCPVPKVPRHLTPRLEKFVAEWRQN